MPVLINATDIPVPSVPGVFMKRGVNLNAAMLAFLTELRARTGFDLVVTSGVRTALEQAQALAQDLNFGVYRQQDLVTELQAGGLSVGELAATLERQLARGRYLSRHMRGDALDFRVWGLTSLERAALTKAAQAMGATTLDEGDHLHVEKIDAWSGLQAGAVALVVGAVVALAVVVVGALIGRASA